MRTTGTATPFCPHVDDRGGYSCCDDCFADHVAKNVEQVAPQSMARMTAAEWQKVVLARRRMHVIKAAREACE